MTTDVNSLRVVDFGEATCTSCELQETRKRVVWSDGNVNANVCFIGDAPDAEEEEANLPLTGETGKFFYDVLLPCAGLTRADIWYTNVLKCRPLNKPKVGQVKACESHLRQELFWIQPKVVVPMGSCAINWCFVRAKLGAIQTVGSVVARSVDVTIGDRSFKMFPVYHPGILKHDGTKEGALKAHFGKLGKLLKEMNIT